MKVLRRIGALVVWLLATLLAVVSLVLCLTLVLLPLGIPLLLLSGRLYVWGVKLWLPRPKEVRRHMRKEASRLGESIGIGQPKKQLKRWRKRLRKAKRPGIKGRL
jgi:uncharacterized membrane protein